MRSNLGDSETGSFTQSAAELWACPSENEAVLAERWRCSLTTLRSRFPASTEASSKPIVRGSTRGSAVGVSCPGLHLLVRDADEVKSGRRMTSAQAGPGGWKEQWILGVVRSYSLLSL